MELLLAALTITVSLVLAAQQKPSREYAPVRAQPQRRHPS